MSDDGFRYRDLWLKPADDRIYAMVRIGFALTALLNLLSLWPLRLTLFSHAGLFPQDTVIQNTSTPYVSVFELLESPAEVSGYMVFSAFWMMMLGLGVLPRLSSIFVFIWYLSFLNRIPLATNGWDMTQGAFSFLVMVSPKGRSWALCRDSGGETLNYGLTLMRLQVIVIYFGTVLSRIADPYWHEGTFLSWFMLAHTSRFPGPWVLDSIEWLRHATWMAIFLELAIPILLSIRRTRWWGFALGIVFHGTIVTVARDLHLFWLTMTMTFLAFLRHEDIETFSSFFRPKQDNV